MITSHTQNPMLSSTPCVEVNPLSSNNNSNLEGNNQVPPLSPLSTGSSLSLSDSSHPPFSLPTDSEAFSVFDSPNGTRSYCPDVTSDLKPYEGSMFDTWDDVVTMYENYAMNAGFSVRKGQTKKWKEVVTHKYLRCSKSGRPQPKRKFDTLCESSMYVRQRSYTVSDCKAHISLQVCKQTSKFILLKFVENHNHSLVENFNRDLTKIARKLPFSTKQFIHHMSLNRIGPTIAHRLQVSMMGGHHNVHGTPDDFKNFYQSMRIFISDRDSQLVVERLKDRFHSLPSFYFDFTVEKGKLKSVFWADEISKLNYKVFGDVLAFDATYKTNKYNMIFVPFTGVDHHKKCVTFGAGLLSNETIDSYKWLLEAFLKAHVYQPKLVLSDQDPSMRQAILQVFPQSVHRLCMWHIMMKLPSKISGDLLQNTNIRACIHRLVWNLYIKPSTFESRWLELMDNFQLKDHDWLNEMYAIRDRWVPAYFREIPMCCLMKMTSRCENSNASFKVNSSCANTLVQFMLCYETRLDHQRYRQRRSEFKTFSATFKDKTELLIEKHAFDIYSQSIFLEVRKEIMKGMLCCYISKTEEVDSSRVFSVIHLDKRKDVTNEFQVQFDRSDNSASCSCMCFTRIGYLCRHIFCVYRMKKVEKIPAQYIMERWRRDVLPKRIFSIEYRYGVDNSPQTVLRNKILELVTECVDVLRCDTEGLSSFANHITDLKSNLLSKSSNVVYPSVGNGTVIEYFLGQSIDVDVSISNPDGIRNKGTGHVRRIISQGEKQSEKCQKAPRLCRTCLQYVTDHDSRNCKKKNKESTTDCGRNSNH